MPRFFIFQRSSHALKYVGNDTAEGQYCSLELQSQVNLEYESYSFVYGLFGRETGNAVVCSSRFYLIA
jgi:hypothetical protein